MHLRALLASTFLLAGLAGTPAVAQTVSSTLEARDSWQSAQVLMRSGMKMEVAAREGSAAQVFWLFMERTPSGHMRVLVKDTPDGKDRLTLLIQGSRGLAIYGEDVFNPVAPWMIGNYLFEQSLEPAMLLQWSIGLPGKSFSVDAEVARVARGQGQVERIEQSGWKIDYTAWNTPEWSPIALPKQFTLTGETSTVKVTVLAMDAFEKAPADYSEFKIM